MGRKTKGETLIYGRRAAITMAKHRPEEILRVFYLQEAPNRDLGPLLKSCAERRRPYRAVSAEELAHVAKTEHHEGVVIIARRSARVSLESYAQRLDHSEISSKQLPLWIALDRVDNDHNRGAIARSLAWFGGRGMIWCGQLPQLSGAALRVAQGGAEEIDLLAVNELSEALALLRARGVLILGADQHGADTPVSIFERPDFEFSSGICWVMGSERYGLSDSVKRQCDQLITIPGSGSVESLNVSVSAGILMAQSVAWLTTSIRT